MRLNFWPGWSGATDSTTDSIWIKTKLLIKSWFFCLWDFTVRRWETVLLSTGAVRDDFEPFISEFLRVLVVFFPGLFASRLFAASDLVSVNKPPFNAANACCLHRRDKMAAHGTLGFLQLSSALNELWAAAGRCCRFCAAPRSAVNICDYSRKKALLEKKAAWTSESCGAKMSSSCVSLSDIYILLFGAAVLSAAGLIISHCTAGRGQMWILYSGEHRLYTFISSHSPQQCKCHVEGGGRGVGAFMVPHREEEGTRASGTYSSPWSTKTVPEEQL